MVLIRVPASRVPAGMNPYEFYIGVLESVFDMDPVRGFTARLAVLWALCAYGLIMSMVYFGVLVIEYRQRKKTIWLWRLVRRSNGRYIVGNQHALFAIFSLITCAVMIGYLVNFHQVFVLKTHQDDAFYWRTTIFIAFGVQLWVTSFANLQAGILASQAAAKKYILSPVLANTFYIGAFLAMLLSCLSLDIVCGVAWAQCWRAHVQVLAQLRTLSVTRVNDTPAQAAALVNGGLLNRVNSRLGLTIATLRAINALYAFGFTLIIAANLGGLALLFTLRRQINFNMRRMSDDQAVSTPGIALTPPEENGDPLAAAAPRPFSFATRINEKSSSDSSKSPARQVVFVRSVEQRLEGPGGVSEDRPYHSGKGMSVGELKQAAANDAPASAANRAQAKQLLALRKVQWDVIVLLIAIVIIALTCVAIGLWLAISPTSVYARWATTEVAYFLVPWMFLLGIDFALSFLLFNALRHLVPNDSIFAKLFGQGKATARRSSASGLLSSDELDSMATESREVDEVAIGARQQP
ncbi:hypothetical protein BMF94_6295 [Rhodotorula taiwanensis]|uniref:Uncharacterized protein n=1 Tax=Rhodotorula taiwanensis TaxID=741276 RepID=A0A2S5B1Z8_9BASI|nr:hypothetical protein BMF94_6295 [Rhodotorula taiwanensis]